MPQLRVLLIGEAGRGEFGPAVAVLGRYGSNERFPTFPEALAWLAAADTPPDLAVLLASRPGEFALDALQGLARQAPLCRVVAVLGSWCEGETRSGRPLPGVHRVYWHQAVLRLECELAALGAGRAASFALPVTATDEERLLADLGPPPSEAPGAVIVHAALPEPAAWLTAACRAAGLQPYHFRPWPTLPPVSGAAAGIYDGAQADPLACREIERLAAVLPGAPLVALLNFPRAEDAARAKAAGATAVLGKPVLVADLWAALRTPPATLHAPR